jgi:hypothetical protein
MKSGARRDGAERMWRAASTTEPLPAEWAAPVIDGEAVSLGARLSELLAQETPEELLARLGEFRRSVEEALERSSNAYRIMRQLETSGLKDCARCTQELEERLARNPHYALLGKLDEAHKLVSDLTTATI